MTYDAPLTRISSPVMCALSGSPARQPVRHEASHPELGAVYDLSNIESWLAHSDRLPQSRERLQGPQAFVAADGSGKTYRILPRAPGRRPRSPLMLSRPVRHVLGGAGVTCVLLGTVSLLASSGALPRVQPAHALTGVAVGLMLLAVAALSPSARTRAASEVGCEAV